MIGESLNTNTNSFWVHWMPFILNELTSLWMHFWGSEKLVRVMFFELLEVVTSRGLCDLDGVAVSKIRLNKDFFGVHSIFWLVGVFGVHSNFWFTGVLGDNTCFALKGLVVLPKSVSSGKRGFFIGDGPFLGDWNCRSFWASLVFVEATGIFDLISGEANAFTAPGLSTPLLFTMSRL